MTAPAPLDFSHTDARADARPLGPRIRWAGIVWGAVFSALALAGLWIIGSEERRTAAWEWLSDLSVPTMIGSAVLAFGALLLVAGLVGLLRRAQKAVGDRGDAE